MESKLWEHYQNPRAGDVWRKKYDYSPDGRNLRVEILSEKVRWGSRWLVRVRSLRSGRKYWMQAGDGAYEDRVGLRGKFELEKIAEGE